MAAHHLGERCTDALCYPSEHWRVPRVATKMVRFLDDEERTLRAQSQGWGCRANRGGGVGFGIHT